MSKEETFMNKRAVLVVMDSVGIGELPDAKDYGDQGSDTLGNISAAVNGLKLDNLRRLGLGNIPGIKNIDPVSKPIGCYGKMAEKSMGKDTTTGHWEIAGLRLERPFPVYPDGFPKEIIKAFENKIERKTLGNKPASGTQIIQELGEEHIRTGYPIVYTSADSVFQVAAHEDVIPVDKLYEICIAARELLTGEHAVARVIARPFVGSDNNFTRTSNRRDFSLDPPGRTILDIAYEAGYEVKAVGKIEDIFNKRGITEAVHIENNMDGVDKTLEMMKKDFSGIVFTNLVDFDMVYGHRNNIAGYARALEEFDGRIPEIIDLLQDEDILIITADHGCDPTTASTDHSREYVPLLVYGKKIASDICLGVRETFSDVAATISDFLGIERPVYGTSFYREITE